MDGTSRFGDFRDRLGIASNLLAARLDSLVEAGVLQRIPYQEPGTRQRYEYRLTESGLDLRPTLVALLKWGDKYVADPSGPSVVVRHRTADTERDCEEPVGIVLECAAGHTHLPPAAIHRTPGPGARFVKSEGDVVLKGLRRPDNAPVREREPDGSSSGAVAFRRLS
jgi:DNA-binding HxlR family transcriptional regulator